MRHKLQNGLFHLVLRTAVHHQHSHIQRIQHDSRRFLQGIIDVRFSVLSRRDVPLPICGGFQMLGSYYETYDGKRCDFIGALDLCTIGSKTRMIGNYKFQCGPDAGGSVVVGFENHSGKTRLGSGVKPLGTVLAGYGNNGEDKTEGVHYKNVFGTYSHGPLLPKNPALCDEILRGALCRKYGAAELAPLDDAAEESARQVMLSRLHIL